MDAATHFIAAMRDRPDRIASALWIWLQRHDHSIEDLAAALGCTAPEIERLALVPLPQPGTDWDDDVEIIEISLRLRRGALRALLLDSEASAAHELGA